MKREDLLKLFDCPNSLGDQLVNAGVIAGFNFFGALAGIGALSLVSDWKAGLVAATISAGVGFFGSLMAQRGLRKPGNNNQG